MFCMPASSIIPLHNHPGMTVLSKVLYGAAHVRSYRWIESAGSSINLSKARPAKVVRDGEMSAPCGAMVLRPEEGGDVHALRAITPCAILHILTPPYSSQDGRHCSYFRRRPRSHPSGSDGGKTEVVDQIPVQRQGSACTGSSMSSSTNPPSEPPGLLPTTPSSLPPSPYVPFSLLLAGVTP
ncbi:cupin, RmlC-type isoform X2 [Zea mays]|nr:cupin, RmlC-type isoform X2 [Zea mays]